MILEFERRNMFSFLFQTNLFVNMNRIAYILVVRTRIYFYTSPYSSMYVPRTEKNINTLNTYINRLSFKELK